MKTFYVLWDGTHYLCGDGPPHSYSDYLGDAERFDTLPEALDFNNSSGLQLQVLRVEITVAYAPDLFTEGIPCFPGTAESVPQLDDPRWQEPTDEIVGYKCYGIDPNGNVGRGTLNRHHGGYFYIYQYGGFEFGVSRVIISEKP